MVSEVRSPRTLQIYCGYAVPYTAVGEHQCRLLGFAERYRGWHSFKNDRTTRRAIEGLARRGSIEVNDFSQFRLSPTPLKKG